MWPPLWYRWHSPWRTWVASVSLLVSLLWRRAAHSWWLRVYCSLVPLSLKTLRSHSSERRFRWKYCPYFGRQAHSSRLCSNTHYFRRHRESLHLGITPFYFTWLLQVCLQPSPSFQVSRPTIHFPSLLAYFLTFALATPTQAAWDPLSPHCPSAKSALSFPI